MRVVMLLPLLMLAACGRSSDDADRGATPDQARELNQAAAMLDANSVSAAAVINQDNAQ